MIVGIIRREEAIDLQQLAWQVAASAASLASKHGRPIREQIFERLARAGALEHLREQPWGQGELVALAGQAERVQLTERQQVGQIVAAVERA